MSKALYKNNAESITAAAILAADLTVTLATGDGVLFPSPAANQHAVVTLTDGINFEIVRVTNNTADVLTIVRAQEGTTALDWAAGATVSQRLTAIAFENLLDLEGEVGAGQQSVRAGIGSTATGNNSVAVGKNCSATGFDAAVAMGVSGAVGGRNAVAVGTSTTANGDYDAAIGSDCQVGAVSYTYYSAAIGTQCVASDAYAVAMGSKCTASGNSALAVGYTTSATAQKSVAVGYSCLSNQLSSVALGVRASSSAAGALAVGYFAQSTGVDSVAVGKRQVASATNSIAIGTADATNSLPDSAMIQGALAMRASFASAAPHRDFASAEVVFMTEALPLTAIGNKVISLPAGAVFIPSSAGIVVTDQTGVITAQPTVQVSTSTDNITFTPLTPAALMTALNAPRKFEDLAIGAQTQAGLFLKGEVTVAGASTLLYNARYYIKGIVVQE